MGDWTFLPRFILAMAKRLDANDHKGGWSNSTVGYLRRRLSDEVRELKRAIESGESPARVLEEAADVANFAAMLADVYEYDKAGEPEDLGGVR